MESTPLQPPKESKTLERKFQPAQARKLSTGKASSLQITFNLITAGLGTGVFTLPWSTAGASVFPALAIIALVLVINAFTIMILVEAAERHQTFDIGGLVARLPGRVGQVAQYICNSFMWFSLFLCLLSFIIVMVDCMEGYLSDPTVTASGQPHPHRGFLVAIACLCIMPLSFLDQRRMAFTSVLALVANLNILAFMFTSAAEEAKEGARQPICYFGLGAGSIAMVSAMMQVVVIQMVILPMYAELEHRSPAKFQRIVAVSFSVLFMFCSGYALAGYTTYGQSVSSNVLKNFAGTHWGYASRLSAVAAVAGVFPIVLSSMVAPISSCRVLENYRSSWLTGFASVGIIAMVMAVCLFVSDLGQLNVFNGAASMGVYAGLVPSAVGLYLLGPKSSEGSWRAGMYGLAIMGVAGSVLGLLFSDNYSAALKSACSWPKLV